MRTAEIPAWTCFARPYHRNGMLCETWNPAQTRYCTECGCAFWVSSEHGRKWSPRTTALVEHRTIEELCGEYRDAQERIRELYELAQTIQVETNYGTGFDARPEALAKLEDQHRRALWQKIVRESNISAIMSQKRKAEFTEALHRGEIPEIDPETVRATLQGWRDQMPHFLKENIRAVFEWLTPAYLSAANRPGRGYESNDGMTIGKRVVLEWMCESDWSGGARINYQKEAWLQDLDNIFHLYDGKGFATEGKPSALLPALKSAMRDARRDTVETPYFKVRWFRNGNMHIFPNQEIADRINADMLADRLPTCEIPEEVAA